MFDALLLVQNVPQITTRYIIFFSNMQVDEYINSAAKNDDSTVCCQKGKHFLILDEQIGLMCKYCSFVHLERKYILPPFVSS